MHAGSRDWNPARGGMRRPPRRKIREPRVFRAGGGIEFCIVLIGYRNEGSRGIARAGGARAGCRRRVRWRAGIVAI